MNSNAEPTINQKGQAYWSRIDEKKQKRFSVLSLALFFIGMVIGIIFLTMATWADYEASIFDSSMSSDARLRTLRCPILLGKDHFGTVKASFHNPSDRKIQPIIQARISDGLVTLMRQDRARLPLEPGETSQKEWTIYPDDAVWNRFIMVRILQYRDYPVASRTATCGVVLVNLPWVSGNFMTASLTASSIILMGAGLFIWVSVYRPLRGKRNEAAISLLVIGLTITFGILMTFLQAWILAAFALLLTLIMLLVMTGYFISNN